MFPLASSLCTGAQLEPAQLSYWTGDAPGGTSGFAPQRSTTHTDSPSLSMATPFNAPHFLPSGSLPHGAVVRYGLGRSLVGWTPLSVGASAPQSMIVASAASATVNAVLIT